MSMNLILYAEAYSILRLKNNKIKQQLITKTFELWQTPTKITMKAIETNNHYEVYKDWVLSISEDREMPIYSEEDIWNDGPAVGCEIVNHGEDHISDLDEWLKLYEDWDIKWEMI